MAEFVVYEDSPLAEYLNCKVHLVLIWLYSTNCVYCLAINEPETTVKVTPPTLFTSNLNNNNSNLHKRLSISKLWRHSMFHV